MCINKFKLLVIIILLAVSILPVLSFATEYCLKTGYTITTINGMLSNDDDAKRNATDLAALIKPSHNGESVIVRYLLNPSHFGGVGDALKSIQQKIFDWTIINDYDLGEIIKSASEKVETQKLLIISHSQGNFYANSFYNTVVDKLGGVPKESIGIYAVATPSDHVSGDGMWITSKTDKIISGWVTTASEIFQKKVLEPNVNIELKPEDDTKGHDFSKIYLKYQSKKIISDIEASLDKLSTNNIQDEQGSCIDPPKLSLMHKVTEIAFAIIDPGADEAVNIVREATLGVSGAVAVVAEKTTEIVSLVYDFGKAAVSSVVSVIKNNAQIPNENLLAEISTVAEGGDSTNVGGSGLIGPQSTLSNIVNRNSAGNEITDLNNASVDEGSLVKSREIIEEDEDLAEALAKQKEVLVNEEVTLDSETAPNNTATSTASQLQIVDCSFATSKIATHQNILLNEIAWMGGVKSANDEWMELKNISNTEVNVSGWQILNKDEQIKITFPTNIKIAAGGFLLLERTDDNSVSNINADIIYTGATSNSDEALRLFDNQCNLIDEVSAGGEWPAGEASSRRTMERQADLTWGTYSGIGEGGGDNVIYGTPKKVNTVNVVSSGGGGSGSSSSSAQNINIQPDKILISEVQITGGTGKTNYDFVELYNPNTTRVNLNGYRLVKRTKTGATDTSIKSWTSDVYIEAKSYYLWANSGFTTISATPDATTSSSLTNDNGVALRYGAADTGTIIDSVAWGAAENAFIENNKFAENPGVNKSIQRKLQNNEFLDTNDNSLDFEIQNCPSPKAQSAVCQNVNLNQAPSAFFDINPLDPGTGRIITFNAASSTSASSSIVLYDWDFGDGQLASSTQATTTHIYSLAGNYTVALTITDNNSEGSTSELNFAVASSTALSRILISEIMPGAGTGRTDEEFVELYNPTDEIVNLTGLTLKRRDSQNSTTTQTLVRDEDFANKTIAAKAFLLITSLEHTASTSADIIYSNSSYKLAHNDDVVVLMNNNSEIIDEVYYANIESGKSYERKAYSNACVLAQNNGEFLGNNCDTDVDANDFDIRDISKPQNSHNFIEPRSAPTIVTNFSAVYDQPNSQINFSWDVSQDYLGATSTLAYKIIDVSSTPLLADITTASTSATTSITQLGRDYIFTIRALDNEGLGSGTATSTVNVPDISIVDVNYFLTNQETIIDRANGSVGQVFKPLATGTINSVKLNFYTGNNGLSDVTIRIYEWLGGATTTLEMGKGTLIAESATSTLSASMASTYPIDWTWNFGDANQIVLNKNNYYYLETNIVPISGALLLRWAKSGSSALIDGSAWNGAAEINDLYVITKAVDHGTISITSPQGGYIYESTNLDLALNYVEPVTNKYNSIILEVKDYYTGEVVNSSVINLTEEQRLIGRHSLTQSLQITRPGFFKLTLTFANCTGSCELSADKSESNFSIRGSLPSVNILLNQTDLSDSFSARNDFGVAQSFKPQVNGQLNSITLKLSTSGSGWNYTSFKIYEWLGGEVNTVNGSKGQLLATSDSKNLWHSSAYPEPADFTWSFSGANQINLDSNIYYYLELVIDSQSNGGAPTLYFKGSNNNSLIDGRSFSPYATNGDLYMIVAGIQGL